MVLLRTHCISAMKKMWVLIGSIFLGASVRASADTAQTETPPKVVDSSASDNKEAASAAQPEAVKPPATPSKKVAPVRTDLNEMKGKVLSISYDPKTLRLIADGGFNVEFTYDAQTSLVNGGEPIRFDDLSFNDQLVVRYSGKELYAVEIVRVSKAPRPE